MNTEDVNRIAWAVADMLRPIIVKHEPVEWLTVPEMCERMKISRARFDQNVARKMPFLFRPGGRGSQYRARRDEFEKWLLKIEKGEIEI